MTSDELYSAWQKAEALAMHSKGLRMDWSGFALELEAKKLAYLRSVTRRCLRCGTSGLHSWVACNDRIELPNRLVRASACARLARLGERLRRWFA